MKAFARLQPLPEKNAKHLESAIVGSITLIDIPRNFTQFIKRSGGDSAQVNWVAAQKQKALHQAVGSAPIHADLDCHVTEFHIRVAVIKMLIAVA
jgi:hypothetical protein